MNVLQKLWSRARGANAPKRFPKKRQRAALGVERLGDRIVPAGNVTGVVQNGSLILTGDGADNEIEVSRFLGSTRITSLAGTAINGAVGLVDFSGVYKDVIIRLHGGDDLVQLEGGGASAAIIARDLVFEGRGGADTLISLAGASVGRDLIFTGGGGLSNTTLDDIDIGRNAIFTGKAGVSVATTSGTQINGLLSVISPTVVEVAIDSTTLGSLNVVADVQAEVDWDFGVVGSATIQGGTGADDIDLFGPEILGNLSIKTRAGSDIVDVNADVGGNATINLGGGANQDLDFDSSTVYGNLTVLTKGSGINSLNFDGVEVLGRTTLTTGAGADSVTFNDATFNGRVTLFTAAGADQVQVSTGNHVRFRGPTVLALGDGADTLTLGMGIGEADFATSVTIDGGKGADILNDVNSDFHEAPDIQKF